MKIGLLEAFEKWLDKTTTWEQDMSCTECLKKTEAFLREQEKEIEARIEREYMLKPDYEEAQTIIVKLFAGYIDPQAIDAEDVTKTLKSLGIQPKG